MEPESSLVLAILIGIPTEFSSEEIHKKAQEWTGAMKAADWCPNVLKNNQVVSRSDSHNECERG